tara:strand:+ start:3366 stop:4166 length:801 start_codon:yes stop_codon:yes gene_type:complete
MIDKKHITGIILAGGKSTRMGTDKGFLMLNGKKFVEHSIDALKPMVSKIMIVSDNPDYDIFGLERIDDFIKNAGPVSGIYSGLKHSKTDYNLVLSCDIPLIASKVLNKIIDAIDDASEIIQVESNGKTMPLIALYKKSCADIFYKLLQADERRLRIAVNHCQTKTIALDDTLAFCTSNVNTKTALKNLKMTITIKYFGQIAEVTKKEEESLVFTGCSISELLEMLYSKYNLLKNKDFQVAQNQRLVAVDSKITGKEIALLPPFSGG